MRVRELAASVGVVDAEEAFNDLAAWSRAAACASAISRTFEVVADDDDDDGDRGSMLPLPPKSSL